MNTWVYFASDAGANEQETLRFAIDEHVICCRPFKANGNYNPHFGTLEPDDTILLVYRQGRPHQVRLAPQIAEVKDHLVPRTKVVQEIGPPLANELFAAGYTRNAAGLAQVIQLRNVHPCQFPLKGTYGGRNTIHKLAAEDESYRRLCPSCAANEEPEQAAAPVAASGRGAAEASRESAHAAVAAFPTPPPERRRFDGYVMIDWSSRSQPGRGADSLWIGWGRWEQDGLVEEWQNPPTRVQAIAFLRELLGRWGREGRRTLVGFDFAFGYPRGFAAALHLPEPAWQGVMSYFARNVQDGADNRHNRDAFAAACNAAVSSVYLPASRAGGIPHDGVTSAGTGHFAAIRMETESGRIRRWTDHPRSQTPGGAALPQRTRNERCDADLAV